MHRRDLTGRIIWMANSGIGRPCSPRSAGFRGFSTRRSASSALISPPIP